MIYVSYSIAIFYLYRLLWNINIHTYRLIVSNFFLLRVWILRDVRNGTRLDTNRSYWTNLVHICDKRCAHYCSHPRGSDRPILISLRSIAASSCFVNGLKEVLRSGSCKALYRLPLRAVKSLSLMLYRKCFKNLRAVASLKGLWPTRCDHACEDVEEWKRSRLSR